MNRSLSRRSWIAGALTVLVLAGSAAAADQPRRQVLVFGGTGQLGAEIVRRLAGAGHAVTIFTRPGSDRSRVEGLPVTFVEGDLLDGDSLATALRGRRFDAFITAVRVEDGDIHFYQKIMPPLCKQARAAGVSQFIHSGAVGAGDNITKFAGLGWEKVPGLGDRLKDQGIGEQILRDSGVPYTIIRNTRLYPDGTPATGNARLTEDDSVIDALTRKDLAALTVGCLGNTACLNRIFHVKDGSLPWPPLHPAW